MPLENHNNDSPKTSKRNKKRIWLAAVILILTAMLAYQLLTRRSIEQQLAAIDAALTIPDSENAAIIYNEVFTDYQTPQMPRNFANSTRNISAFALDQPWHSNDYPEPAKWIEQLQEPIGKLLEASRLDKCWFPITDNVAASPSIAVIRRGAVHRWASLLAHAANNDVGEGRIDDAIDKYRCIMQLGRHFRQQPVTYDFQFGILSEPLATWGLTRLVVQGEPNQSQIETIENFLTQPQINWDQKAATMLRTQTLLESRFSLITRIKYWTPIRKLRGTAMYPPDKVEWIQSLYREYLRLIARRRAAAITIALRRHKNKTGKWPKDLGEVKFLAPAEIFIDPLNGGSFEYKLSGDTFKLYSKGLNNIDEDGKYHSERGPDTLEIVGKEDDILFWKPTTPGIREKNTDPRTPDPNENERK